VGSRGGWAEGKACDEVRHALFWRAAGLEILKMRCLNEQIMTVEDGRRSLGCWGGGSMNRGPHYKVAGSPWARLLFSDAGWGLGIGLCLWESPQTDLGALQVGVRERCEPRQP
jgi:hypothetical protein